MREGGGSDQPAEANLAVYRSSDMMQLTQQAEEPGILQRKEVGRDLCIAVNRHIPQKKLLETRVAVYRPPNMLQWVRVAMKPDTLRRKPAETHLAVHRSLDIGMSTF